MNESLLKKHLEQTPRMAPTDAVKLAFQSAFGCGHLLSDPKSCAAYVQREMEATDEDASMPAFTPIGGCLCRMHLAAPEVRRLGSKRIAEMMCLTNERVLARRDNQERFEKALLQLTDMARKGETPFSLPELGSYLTAYRAQGCPPVSHSEMYRAAYHPAYRVVLTDLALLAPVMARLDTGAYRAVAIDGLCGSGKTTLADWLGRLFHTQPIRMDDFFLPFDMRTPERLKAPGGNVHHERFKTEVLEHIQEGSFAYRRFDCHTDEWTPRRHEATPVAIIEGSYSHHPAFEEAYGRLGALRVFVETEEGEQLRRIARRDPDLLEAFRSRWIPLEKTYFQAYDIKDRADIVLQSQPWDRP